MSIKYDEIVRQTPKGFLEVLRHMAAAQRIAHQPPRARCIRLRQNRGDLAREAVVLHARVSPQAR